MTAQLAKVTGWTLQPTTFSEAKEFATLIANSDLAPKDYRGKPGNVLVAIQMGADVGLSPMQSLSNIAVINGRACLWGDAMLAVVQSGPDFVDIIEKCDGDVATCTLIMRGREPITRTFSKADAQKAGLWGKQGPWQQYPSRMLQMRARGFTLRDGDPARLRGLSSAEEVSDYDKPAVVARAPANALPAENKPASVPPPPAAEKDDGQGTITPPCKFQWKASDEWNGKLLVDAPTDVLIEYSDYLAAVVTERKGTTTAKKASALLLEAEAEIALRLEAERTPARKTVDIGAALQNVIDERTDDAKGSWLDPDSTGNNVVNQ